MSILNSDQIADLITTGEVAATYGRANLVFRFTREADGFSRYPWEEYDGFGIVSGWESRQKRPCERILATDGRACLFYDVQESMQKAKREGWGLPVAEAKGLTKKQIAAAAVERDFQYCKKWAAGDIWWECLGVTVYMDGYELGSEYMGGIESNADAGYIAATVGDLVAQLETSLVKEAESRISGYIALLEAAALLGK